jgi:class 3 adenylate cyclase
LATVLFTDIVGSTRMAVEVGDHRWHELLDRHDRLAKQTIAEIS